MTSYAAQDFMDQSTDSPPANTPTSAFTSRGSAPGGAGNPAGSGGAAGNGAAGTGGGGYGGGGPGQGPLRSVFLSPSGSPLLSAQGGVRMELMRPPGHKLETLTDTNFKDWSWTIKTFLKTRHMWELVTTERLDASEAMYQPVWDAYCGFIIGLFMEHSTEDQRAHIVRRDNITPKEIYDTWAAVHQYHGQGQIALLFGQLLNVKLGKNDTVDKTAAELKKINTTMNEISEKAGLNDFQLANILINAASDNKLYDMTRHHLMYVTQEYTCRDVVAAFKAVELNSRDGKSFQSARIGDEAPRNRSKQQPRRNITCYRCNREGHIKRNCPDKTSTEESSEEDTSRKKRKEKREPRKGSSSNKNHKDKGNKDSRNSGRSKSKRLDARVAKDSDTASECSLISDVVEDVVCLGAAVAEDVGDPELGLRVSRVPSSHNAPSPKIPGLRWTIDSGASRHMTVDRGLFVSFKTSAQGVRVGGRRVLDATGVGDIVIDFGGRERRIENVLCVPSLGYNLLSVSALDDKGYRTSFHRRSVEIRSEDGTLLATGIRAGGLYHLDDVITSRALVSGEQEASDNPPPIESVVPEGAGDRLVDHDESTLENDTGEGGRDAYTTAHNKYGHVGRRRLESMHKHVYGLEKLKEPPGFFCNACESNKALRTVKKFRYDKELIAGGRLYFDFWGPYTIVNAIEGIGDQRYFLSTIDEATGYSWLTPSERRFNAAHTIRERLNAIDRREPRTKVRYMRFDNAREFLGLEKELKLRGVAPEYTTEYTPEQNGVAERFNRTIVTMVRCMLQHANLPDGFWPEAAKYANYLRNRIPMSEGESPLGAWTGDKPLVGREHTFGMLCKVHIPKELRKKLSAVTWDGIYMGVDIERSHHRVYVPVKKSVMLATSIRVYEDKKATHLLQGVSLRPNVVPAMSLIDGTNTHYEDESVTPPDAQRQLDSDNTLGGVHRQTGGTAPTVQESAPQRERDLVAPTPLAPPLPVSSLSNAPGNERATVEGVAPPAPVVEAPPTRPEEAPTEVTEPQPTPQSIVEDGMDIDKPEELTPEPIKASSRQHKKFNPYAFFDGWGKDAAMIIQGSSQGERDPLTYKEAMNSVNKFRWREATEDEIKQLIASGTLVIVKRTPHMSVITSKWVYKIKYLPNGAINKFKARLVARGFLQVYGVDYFDSYSPTLRFESLRLLVAVAVRHGLRLYLIDIVGAYLYSDLDADVYMEIPEGWPNRDDLKGHVVKVQKGLYGLKQSGHLWNQKFKTALKEMGFKAIAGDTCVFRRVHDNGDVCFLALYVDDVVIAASSKKIYRQVRDHIKAQFEITDSGLLTAVLGIRVTQCDDYIALDQEHYVRTLLDKHSMSNCKPISTPIDGAAGMTKADDNEPRTNQHEYQQLIGGIMFLNIATRPDLAFAISKLSQWSSDPCIRHRNAVGHALRYLNGTADMALVFRRNGCKPEYYSDAAFADNVADRRTTAGFVARYADAACVWHSRKQNTVATSTTEAEYMALSEGCKSALWTDRWIRSLGYSTDQPLTLLGDNNGSIALTKNPEHHRRTKHIDIQYHYVREKVDEGLVRVEYTDTTRQLADGFTKALKLQPFTRSRESLGLTPLSSL